MRHDGRIVVRERVELVHYIGAGRVGCGVCVCACVSMCERVCVCDVS